MLMRVHLLAGICALGVGWAGGPSDADGPARAGAPSAGVTYSDVSARLAAQDTPLWLHLRIESDGRLALRSALAAAPVAWTERGMWRLTGQPAEDMAALKALHVGLGAALGGEQRPPELMEPDGHSRGRLLVDVAADVPWRHVQWVVAVSCTHAMKVYRLTFLAPGAATWFDVDLPKDGGPGGVVDYVGERVRRLEVKLFRKNLDDPGSAPFTRLRVRVTEQLMAGGRLFKGKLRQAPEPKVLTGGGGKGAERPVADSTADETTIDLAAASAPSGAHMAAWRRLSSHLGKGAGSLRIMGEVKTPPPSGGSVPAADVIEVMQRLRDAGCETVHIEGAPPPLAVGAGGGWDLGR